MPLAATLMDLEIIVQGEISLTETDKYHIVLLICGISKSDRNELIYKR